MKLENIKKTTYQAYTLLELLIVISIFIILAGMSFAAFDGLQNTIKMNEYVLNLEQDIRNVQRASMLLQRNIGEKWIYGLGIDFSDVQAEGHYRVFKWCSSFDDYGHITTRSELPAYDPDYGLGVNVNGMSNGYLPLNTSNRESSTCGSDITSGSQLRNLAGYERNITLPMANITFGNTIRYVLFESVSGRAFFYDTEGFLENFLPDAQIKEKNDILNFQMNIAPLGQGKARTVVVHNLSGKIQTYINNEE